MARTLKSTGIAANLVTLLFFDDDNTTLKEWVSSDVNSNKTTASVTTGTASWKGTTLGWWRPNAGLGVLFPSGHRPTVPAVMSVVFLMIDGPASVAGTMGLLDTVTQGTIVRNGNASDVFGLLGGGSALVFSTTTITSQRSWSLGVTGRNNAGDNYMWYGLESGSSALDTTTAYAGNAPDSGDLITGVGGVVTRGNYDAKYILAAVFNSLITLSDMQSIHNDPVGTLFESGASAVPLLMQNQQMNRNNVSGARMSPRAIAKRLGV